MTRKTVSYFSLGIIFVIISVWQIFAAQQGLKVINLHTTNPPVTILTPLDAEPGSRPTVLIAHGFAGSSVLMRGFALTLAHAGYTAVSWDFQGHGTNPHPFDLSSESDQLLQDAMRALVEAESTGLIDAQRIAIIGHSMGSGVALSYGITQPSTFAVIAISPGYQFFNSSLPYNLLLMAGSLEPRFVANADNIISRSESDIAKVSERKLVIIPNVEHISILFSPTAQKTARLWLDDAFGSQPGASTYIDRRMIWFGLGILGFAFLAHAGMQVISSGNQITANGKPLWLRMMAMLAGGISATIIMWLAGLAGINLNQVLGLLVGGYILLWFGLAGVISLVILRPQITRPKMIELGKGLLAFAALWLGVGLLGNFVWLPWLLIPQRLWLWIPGSIIIFSWFISVGVVTTGTRLSGKIGWWIYQSITVILSLYLAIILSPSLGFIFIILPLVPVMIGLHMLVISSRHGAWAYGISGAMFIAWLLLAVFPLQ